MTCIQPCCFQCVWADWFLMLCQDNKSTVSGQARRRLHLQGVSHVQTGPEPLLHVAWPQVRVQVHARRAVDCTFRVAACAVSKDDLPHMADWRPLRQASSDNLSGHTADGTVRADTEQAAPAAAGGRQSVGQCEFVFTGECCSSP